MENKLLVEKYSPRVFSDLTYNESVTKHLEKISTKTNFSHLIFYGPDGAGKKTRIKLLLQHIFDHNVHKLKIETKEMKVNSTNVQYTIASSNYHIELTPSDNGIHDRHIVNYVIKETASIGNINRKDNKFNKIIVIHEADNLSRDAQSSLRRTMEKYVGNCRIIMSCNQLSKILAPIRSRCLTIRIASPTENDMLQCLSHIRNEEKLKISDLQIQKIISESKRNLRTAIFQLQLSK